ncbi:hypothetical protein [Niabella ginsengisoli]|uniref:Uncharacterized protein n=1 Tax=Niabella ginsengisoli TaxID=522298 RepID=A0ABS9SF03_9BACT|nr:hypothetical protein [Niabella ginsengisoli]MCH5596941.1 hypothetical protein [Niabella ginsengisoli]
MSIKFYGKGVDKLYRYWRDSSVIQNTEQGELFTSIPFVKTYALINGGNELSLQSGNFEGNPTNQKSDACILYASLNPHQIPDSLLKYVPKRFELLSKKLLL